MSLYFTLGLTSLLLASTFIIAIRLFNNYRTVANRYLEYLPRHVWNSISLQKLIDSQIPLPPPTGWVADSDLLVELSRLLARSKPATVVELGSGLSTAVMAAVLRDNGSGHLISIDHDEDYAQATRQSLELTNLQTYAEVVVAPLRKQALPNGNVGWYDLSGLSLPHNIDLVFVDGPPVELGGPNIREPSLDYFWPRLTEAGSIVLDDADRPAEAAFIERWISRHPDAVVRRTTTFKGCVIISKHAP